MIRLVGTLIAALSSLWMSHALAQSPSESLSSDMHGVITHHTLSVGGTRFSYAAEVGRLPIRDVETGEPHGYMGYTAYRLDPADHTPRSVTFIWNGGPGANSSLLHFMVAGPRRYSKGELLDNDETWLKASDLIFVDPIGTGFSRPTKADYGSEFYSTRGDVASVTEFIRCWRALKGVEKASLYLVGESWGAGRAASVGYALESRGIHINGLILISGGWAVNHSYGSTTLREALKVVDMASTAFFYHKTPAGLGSTVAQVRSNTEKWVRDSYAPALARPDLLTERERTALRQALAAHTGIQAESIDAAKLSISPRQFREGILKSEGQVPSRFDLRERRGEQPLFEAPTIVHYFRDELEYHTDLPYIDLEPATVGFAPSGKYPESVGDRWNYATADLTSDEIKAAIEEATRKGDGPPHLGPPLPATEEVLALNPKIKILVASGMYDGFLPCAAGAELLASLPRTLKSSIASKCFEGGHAMYLDEQARLDLSKDVQALISGSGTQR